jgi:hypothetical protein
MFATKQLDFFSGKPKGFHTINIGTEPYIHLSKDPRP